MTDKDNDNRQQQILFNEVDSVSDQVNQQLREKTEHLSEQVLFNNDNIHISLDSEAPDESEAMESARDSFVQESDKKNKNRSWLWLGIGTLFLTLVAIETADFFILGFQQSPIITAIYGLLLAGLGLIAGNALWHELVGLRQFKNRQQMQCQATELLLIDAETLSETSNKAGVDFCNNITDKLPCDLVFDVEKDQHAWQDALAAQHNSRELVQLYSRVVLNKVDDKALNEVARFSTEAVVLIALSPVALVDMLIILSRNLRMINKIAGLYGLKLGYWSRIRLIKQVFVNMAYAGASELIADFGTDMLGAELLGKLSTRFAQGLGAGMLTARLGAKTMELCRPIPFEEKPKLTQVRKKIAQQIKSLVKLA